MTVAEAVLLSIGLILLLPRAAVPAELAFLQGHSFSHMELYELHGEEFLAVAQTNQLLNLRADFGEKFITHLGPRNDSFSCLPYQMQQNLAKCQVHPMDNYIKAMTVHNGHLFLCMSYLSGSCASVRLVKDRLAIDFLEVDRKLQHLTRSLLCRNVEAKTQLTVALKHLGNEVKGGNGLYLSMPFCTTKNLDNAVESVISIVDIKTLQQFRIGGFSTFLTEILPLNSKRRPNTLAYHYSFKYTDGPYEYVYFLLTAKEVVNSEYSQIRVGRLCTSDLYMSGYVEMHIYCSHAEADPGATYGYIGEAATFVKPGSKLAAALNVSAEEPVLFLSSRVMDSSLLSWRQGVCAVPISAINQRLNRIVVDCLQGQAYHGPAYIRDHVKCQKRPESPEHGPQCTPFDSQPEWMGMVGLKEQHKYQASFLVSVDPSVNITSIAALSLYNGATALYVGTSSGRLLRYNVQNLAQQWLYESASLTGGPVLVIKTGKTRLYTLTATQVASHLYANCELQYPSCGSCLKSNNPHCVWSNLDQGGCQTWNRPVLPSPESHVTSAAGCMQVEEIGNSNVCVDQQVERVSVEVQARNAPSVAYYCYYTADNQTVLENRAAELQLYHQGSSVGIMCSMEMSSLRRFLGTRASRNLTLLLSSSPYKPDQYFLEVTVQVFSCQLHRNCSSCTGGHPMCSWCSLKAACAHKPAADCQEDRTAGSIISGAGGVSGSTVSSSLCPTVRLPGDSNDKSAIEVALASGTAARLKYSFTGHQTFMKSFTCTVSCPGGEPADFPGNLRLDTNDPSASRASRLECRTGVLQYSAADAAQVTCTVAFYWSDSTGRKRLFDVSGAAGRLLLYKCSLMAVSCGDCTLGIKDARFHCVWCHGGGSRAPFYNVGTCTNTDQCLVGGFVKRGGLCQGPRIEQMAPAKLTPFPGLQLSVEGSNLGNAWDSVIAQLQPENDRDGFLPCSMQADAYQLGKTFACLVTGVPLLGKRYRLLVSLPGLSNGSQVKDTAMAVSEWLSVANPTLSNLVGQARVQQHGQAELQLTGSHLDAGSDLKVTMLSDQFLQVPTDLLTRNSSRAVVRLGSFHNPGSYFASLTVQGQPESKRDFRPVALEVVPNAELSISSESAAHRTGLIPAGGLQFELPGLRLDAVRQASISFREIGKGDRRLLAECRVDSPSLLICLSPKIPELRLRRSLDFPAEKIENAGPQSPPPAKFSATIHLDALTHSYPANLTLFPDPLIHSLGWMSVQLHLNWQQLEPGRREIQLHGRHLRPGLQLEDIVITIGHLPCEVAVVQTRLDGVDFLTCRHPLPSSAVGVDLEVTARIGRLYFKLGHVTYAVQFNWTYVYVIIPLMLVLLFILLIGALVHAHRRAKRRQEKSSRIEVQINLLEAQVSQNCRDAFAELQLNSSGERKATEEWCALVPTRSFAEFASYSCFTERYLDRHRTQDPLFADVVPPEAAAAALAAEPPEVRKALDQLYNLLLNEDFLLAMIAAMESRSDRSFLYQERNHFGSLLSALLYSDIGYFTRILTRLITLLVARKQEASDNYKVVFRRCESVAERLLPNWLAFLMYEHLSNRVAEPLHRLYRAMKQQIYEGPVDQLTGDSKYTINEQKLLKKEIVFKEITLTFQDRLRVFCSEQQEMLQCRVAVLDCDTVHQAKEKILDAVYTQLQLPSSQRTAAHLFDLARTFGPAGNADVKNDSSKQRYLILTEAQDSNSSVGLQRLKRLGSFSLSGGYGAEVGESTPSSPVVFLKPRREEPLPQPLPPPPSTVFCRGTLGGASGDSSLLMPGSTTWQHTLPDGSARSRLAQEVAMPARYHLLVPSGAGSQSLMDASGRKRKGKKTGLESKKAADRQRPVVERVEGQQIVSEVFYPVMLRTKRLLTDKITDLFSALFPTPKLDQLQPEAEQEVPLCLKYLFDLFDSLVQERQLGQDVSHVWKSNALMLKFYTHHLFNVDYLLDVEVPGPVRYCMSTVSTLFMDACSVEKPAKPDKTSTAQRLLFVNEVAEFHPLVEAYYTTVRSGLRESESYALESFEQQVRLRQSHPFNRDALLREIFSGFLRKYREEIIRELASQRVISNSLIVSLDFVFHWLSNASPYWSKAHTLSSSTQSSTRPFHLPVANPYDPAAC